jgi:hypothetical protein
MTHDLTIRDCLYAIRKHYGIDMTEVDGYPQTFGFKNKKVSLKIYRLPDGQIRMQIIPLDDVINDKYADIDTLNDLFRALEPWRQFIETKQMSLFGWAA